MLLCGFVLAAPGEQKVDELIPPVSTLPGWTVSGGPAYYGPDDLFEYINGAARMYLSFGFERLAHVRWSPADHPGSNIVLDIYDMGSELGAYGVYTSGRPLDAETHAWGSEGYRSGKIAVAWKGSVYIHASCSVDSPPLTGLLEKIVASTATRLSGDAGQPELYDLLPVEGLVRNSDRYVARDLLGHAFLPGGMIARYEIEGELLTLFFCELGSDAAAEQVMAKLREYEELEGKILGIASKIGDEGFRAEDPGLGRLLAARSGRIVAGTFGGPSGQAARRTLARLIANFSAR
jgi:hypothetical protein